MTTLLLCSSKNGLFNSFIFIKLYPFIESVALSLSSLVTNDIRLRVNKKVLLNGSGIHIANPPFLLSKRRFNFS